jgi:pilus assembly protein CpaD
MQYATTTGWFLIVAAMIVGTGCAPDAANDQDVARSLQLDAPKKNQVAFTTWTRDIHFARGAATLSPEETRALEKFIAATIRPGDEVTIAVSQADASAKGNPSVQSALAARREASIARLLPKLPQSPVFELANDTTLAGPRDAATLRVGRYAVIPPKCPDWTKPEADDFTNSPSSNFGCADAMNIGMMVADPADLVRGQQAGGADAAFAARGVEQYRSGAISKSLAALSDTSTPGAGGGQGGGGQGGGSGGGGGS